MMERVERCERRDVRREVMQILNVLYQLMTDEQAMGTDELQMSC